MKGIEYPKEKVTRDYVMKLKSPTSDFLCPLSANIYNI